MQSRQEMRSQSQRLRSDELPSRIKLRSNPINPMKT